MTVGTTYLQETERRLISWGSYYNTIVGSQKRRINNGVVDGTQKNIRYDILPGDIPREIEEVEKIMLALPEELMRPLASWYQEDTRDKFAGCKKCGMSIETYQLNVNRGLHAIWGKLGLL